MKSTYKTIGVALLTGVLGFAAGSSRGNSGELEQRLATTEHNLAVVRYRMFQERAGLPSKTNGRSDFLISREVVLSEICLNGNYAPNDEYYVSKNEAEELLHLYGHK